MYFKKTFKVSSKLRFKNYAFSIKTEILNQLISDNSHSRPFYEYEYDKLFYKYLDKINRVNYSKTCAKFINDVYNLVPVSEII